MTLFLKSFYLFPFRREGNRGRKRERNLSKLPLTRPHLETWPATQACALTQGESKEQTFSAQTGAQSTEPHQSGHHF